MHRVAEIRRTRVSGRMDNHERKVGTDWNVTLQGLSLDVVIAADTAGSTVTFTDGTRKRVEGNWTPGRTLAEMSVDGAPLVLKVGKISGGFRIRNRGADLKVHVRTLRQAELARQMPEKQAADTSKLLLCPMPGLVMKINVEVGDEVQEGQPLCTVEAMKMENILRAERKGIVSQIRAEAGIEPRRRRRDHGVRVNRQCTLRDLFRFTENGRTCMPKLRYLGQGSAASDMTCQDVELTGVAWLPGFHVAGSASCRWPA